MLQLARALAMQSGFVPIPEDPEDEVIVPASQSNVTGNAQMEEETSEDTSDESMESIFEYQMQQHEKELIAPEQGDEEPHSTLLDACFPPLNRTSLGEYDNATLSMGLFAHHKLTEPSDVFGRFADLSSTAPTEGTLVDPIPVTEWIAEQMQKHAALRAAQTVLVLSDTRKPGEISHWKHTSRFFLQRT